MKLDSKIFDKIRIKSCSDKKQPEAIAMCEWPGCEKPGRHKAPKGRGFEGQFFTYCTAHVQEYNKSYNYFNGMKDDDVAGFQKDAQTGHRPTWKRGQSVPPSVGGTRRPVRGAKDPFNLFTEKDTFVKPERTLRRGELKALQTLGLGEKASPEDVKKQYKILVKRLHPDANGGSRDNEDTLQSVIQAYDLLKASGFC
jgi:hypothetical protein